MSTSRSKFSAPALALLSLGSAGCEIPSSVVAGNSSIQVFPNASPSPGCSPVDTLPSDAVCDPFGGAGQSAGLQYGLYSSLYYLNPGQTQYGSAEDYINHGQKFPADLFFNQLNVPTRPFSEGFATQNGTVLTTPAGDTLYEWFGLRFETQVQLGHLDHPGFYEFALVSDDGSIMRVGNTLGGFDDFINNDGTTPTRMACAPHAMYFDQTTRVPVQVDYFQGPRYHIALLLVWREVAADTASDLHDAECGQNGNDYFFDSTQTPSAPSSHWLGLLDRGWKVLSTDNYLLPDQIAANPCTGSCFTDRYSNPSWGTFTLSHNGIDPSSLKVTVDGTDVPFTYDAVLNVIVIPGYAAGTHDVHIGYCLANASPSPSPSPTHSASPSPSPTVSASPTPSPTPSASHSAPPSPSPSPSCTGSLCGGGEIGV